MLTGFQQYFTVKLGYKFLNELIVKDLTMYSLYKHLVTVGRCFTV